MSADDESPKVRSDSIHSEELHLQDNFVNTSGKINDEGRINISLHEKGNALSKLFQPYLSKSGSHSPKPSETPILPTWLANDVVLPPPLNVVIQIVGSRGDVQPFIALGKVLSEKYGHRVRLATHAMFKDFVLENGLEFFSIGGDPAGLMDYMVKNPGLLPRKESLKQGDVNKRKKDIREILLGCWRSCIEPGDGMPDDTAYSGVEAENSRPFVANAIIANPPSFAHVHIAEKLGIPFHLMFTMPWTPTTAFPHPLANIQTVDTDPRIANYASYSLVQVLTIQGLGPILNEFRSEVLGLDPISVVWLPKLISESKVPFTYCWSPALIPKPQDWGSNIHVAGFYFLKLASTFKPDPDLVKFLEAGPPPVYIGFGSIVVADPDAMTSIIFEAIKRAGVRALVSKGWGGLGGDKLDTPDNVYMLGNVPHDWLFQRVSAVCHHGGAGTTAAGIAAGCPTIVVPFFGDQPFWGSMVHRAGAGPEPVPYKHLTAEKLAGAIQYCLKPEIRVGAQKMAEQISNETGPEDGSKHFHVSLPMERLRCSCDPASVAVFRVRRTDIRLSALAVAVLVDHGVLKTENLKLNRTQEYDLSEQPWDPMSGAATAIIGNLSNFVVGTASLPSDLARVVRTRTKRPKSDVASVKSMPSSLTKLSRPYTKSATYDHSDNYVCNAAHMIAKDGFNLVKIPRETILGLAKGFHNAPKLYHDRTVRTPDKVTNLRSGLKVAGKELGFGAYDAVTGVVTQPYHGAKDQGAVGFLKGAGKGIGGLILKPQGAIFGAIGYTMDGMYKHNRNSCNEIFQHTHGQGISVEEQISANWLLEGYDAFAVATKAQKRNIIQRWEELQKAEQSLPQGKLAHRFSTRSGASHSERNKISHGTGLSLSQTWAGPHHTKASSLGSLELGTVGAGSTSESSQTTLAAIDDESAALRSPDTFDDKSTTEPQDDGASANITMTPQRAKAPDSVSVDKGASSMIAAENSQSDGEKGVAVPVRAV